MKTIIYLFMLLSLLLSGCSSTLPAQNHRRGVANLAKGSINPSKQTPGPKKVRKLTFGKDVTIISNSSPLDITYVQDSKAMIEIIGPENRIRFIKAVQSKNTLNIYVDTDEFGSIELEGVSMRLYSPGFSTLNLYGTGDFRTQSMKVRNLNIGSFATGDVNIEQLRATSVSLTTSGTGDITIANLSATSLNAMINGTGDITISDCGANSSVRLMNNGTGKIQTLKLSTNSLVAHCTGTGDIQISGTAQSAVLSAMGTGDIIARKLKAERVQTNKMGIGEIYR